MTVFISSTCYDLTDLRAEIEKFLVDKGHTLLLSDRNNFPVNLNVHRHDVCIENVSRCDLFVLVLDSRYGAPYYRNSDISITWAELREAIRTHRKTIAFVRRDIFNERQTCRHNLKLGNLFSPFFADNIKTFDIVDEVQTNENGIWMQPFDNSINIKEKLESLYDTKHSLLNSEEPKFEMSFGEIPLTALSGSTASFIIGNSAIGTDKNVSAEILQTVIDKIPENAKRSGEILESESISDYSNDFYYFFPLNEKDGIDIYPTALGRSVRNELKDALQKIENENDAIALFTDTVKRKPILCKSCQYQNRSYIIGFYEKASEYFGRIQHICILYLFANKWQIYFDQAVDEFECYPELSDKCEIIVHDGKLYFYFERSIQRMGTMYNGIGLIEFTIFDFENRSVNKLQYEGTYRKGSIEGEFNFDLFSKDPNANIYKFILEKEASKSKYIYRTPKDYDIDNPENYIEKWIVENPDFYNNENGKINFFYYIENIFWDMHAYGSLESYMASNSNIENDNYIIFYYFAGPILAMRKADKKYFVILVPQGYGAGGSWGIRSIKSVEYLTSDKILAQNDYERYEIDLTTNDYTRKKIEVTNDRILRRLKSAKIR